MELRTLEQFVAVAEELSVTRAALRLYAAQSTVSAGLRSLERELGTTLFVRTTRSMRLTPAGERALPEARATLAAAARLRDATSEDGEELRGRVRLGSFAALDVIDLPRLVADFRGEHPLVDLALVASATGSSGLLDDLRHGRIDLAFSGLADEDDPELASVPLLSFPFVALVAPTHRLARRRRVRLADLADEPWVDTLDGYGNRVLLDRTLRERSLRRRLVVQLGDLPSVPGFVAAGVGVAVVPDAVPTGECVRIAVADGPAPWQVSLHWRRDQPLGAAARTLVDVLVEAAGAASSSGG
ncbi:LysR family transcriptional regulator [Nocardioides lijunqiniae]|uniref:LysR family transcriptional regulator n=1 Tax=Nocardioides lijunqiniae TaxID=2760832 RepID=UPI0018789F99|nr:LysR family transcriptional regulator [Nocardioides lijunqiniae]